MPKTAYKPRVRTIPLYRAIGWGMSARFVELPQRATVSVRDFAWATAYRWSLTTHGYPIRRERGPTGHEVIVRLHRAVYQRQHPDVALATGPNSSTVIHHVDKNKLNVTRGNLVQLLRRRTNGPLGRKMQQRGGEPVSSKYKGVHRAGSNGRWAAQIQKDGVRHTEYFYAELEAAEAILRMHYELFPDYAPPFRLNGATRG